MTGVNDLPVAAASDFAVLEGGDYEGVLGGVDAEGADLSYRVVQESMGGAVVVQSDGSFVYTHAGGNDAVDSFTFEVCDGGVGVGCSEVAALVSVEITPVNDAPVFTAIVDQVAVLGEAYELDLNVFGEAVDEEGDNLSWGVGISSNSMWGETLFQGDVSEVRSGVFVFDPQAAGFDGKIEFGVTLTDSGSPAKSVTQSKIILDWIGNAKPVMSETLEAGYVWAVDEGSALVVTLSDDDKSDVEDNADKTKLVWSVLGFDIGEVEVDEADINKITFTPDDENFDGTVEVSLVLSDSLGATDVKALGLTWNGVNDVPTAAAMSVGVVEGGEALIVLDGSDVDDGDNLVYSIEDVPTKGSAVLSGSVVVYENTDLTASSDSFTYRVYDGTAYSTTETVTVDISSVNNLPVASDGVLTVAEDGVGGGTLSATDIDDVSLVYSVVKGAEYGVVEITDTGTGAYTYTHNGDEVVEDSFTFKASDGKDSSNIASVVVTVDPVNDAPSFTDLFNMSSPTGQILVLNLNDLMAPRDEEDGVLVWAASVSGWSGGDDDLADGVLTLTPPDENFQGQIDLDITLTDDGGAFSVQNDVVVTWLDNVNPEIRDDLETNYTTIEDEDITITLKRLDGVDEDEEGGVSEELVWNFVGFDVGEVIQSGNTFNFTPDENFVDFADVTLMLKDKKGGFDTKVLTLTWTEVNDAPVASGGYFSVDEGGFYDVGELDVEDIDGPSLVYELVNFAANGSVVLDENTGAFTYTHYGSETTGDRFTFRAFDGEAYSDVAEVSITVAAVNDVPVVEDASGLAVDEGGQLLGNLAASDAEGDGMTYVVDTEPLNGTVDIDPVSGVFDYQHGGGENVSDSFSFKVGDGFGISEVATVSFNVSPVNDAPVIGDIVGQSIPEGESFVPVSLDDFVVDADNLDSDISWSVSATENLSVVIDESRVMTVSLVNSAWSGTEVVALVAQDPAGAFDTLDVSFSVAAVNSALVLSVNESMPVQRGGTVSVLENSLLVTDPDIDSGDQVKRDMVYTVNSVAGGSLRLSEVVLVVGGTFTQADIAAGVVDFVQSGVGASASFGFDVSDGEYVLSDNVFSLSVVDDNAAPVLTVNRVLIVSGEDGAATITPNVLKAVDSDWGDGLTFFLLEEPVNGELRLDGVELVAGNYFTQEDIDSRSLLSYVYGGGTATADSFGFMVKDDNGEQIASQTFSISINLANTVPVVGNISGQTIAEGGAFADISLDNYVYDPDVGHDDANIVWSVSGGVNLSVGIVDRVASISVVNAGWSGSETITFTATDPVGAYASVDVVFNVTGVNDVPVLSVNNELSVSQGGAVTILSTDLRVTDLDITTGSQTTADLEYVLSTAPVYGVLSLNGFALSAEDNFTQSDIDAGNVVYAHGGGDETSDGFSFAASDGIASVAGGPFDFVIAIVVGNSDPVLDVNSGLTLYEGDSALITHTKLSFVDVDQDVLTYTLAAVPENGSLKRDGVVLVVGDVFTQDNITAGGLSYAHGGGENIEDSFSFNVTDGNGGQVTNQTFDIIINAVNDVPVAVGVSISVDEGGEVSGTLNALDAESENLIYAIVVGPQSGSFSAFDVDTGEFAYSHNGGGSTVDFFTFTAEDEDGAVSESRIVNVTINPFNDDPSFLNIPNQATGVGDIFSLDLGLLGQPQDEESLDFHWSVKITSSNVDGGSAPAWGGKFYETAQDFGVFEFDPEDESFDGKISVKVTLFDNSTNPASAVQENVEINWNVNEAPVIDARLKLGYLADEDTAIVVSLSDDDKSDNEDSDGNLLWRVVGFEDGSVQAASGDIAVGVSGGDVTFTPDDDYFGEVEVVLILTDSGDRTDQVTLSFEWVNQNDAPVAEDVATAVLEGRSVLGNFVAEDKDGDSLIYSLVEGTGPARGDVTFNAATGSFVYDHNGGESVVDDTFDFRVTDPSGAFDDGTVTVSITAQNDAPVVSDGGVFAAVEDVVYVNSANDGLLSGLASDADFADILSYSIVTPAEYGVVTITEPLTGAFTYLYSGDGEVPDPLVDTFEFRVGDGKANSNNGLITVNLTAIDDVPSFSVIPDQGVPTGDAFDLRLDLIGEGFDEEDGSLTWTVVENSGDSGDFETGGGAFSETSPGVFGFNPNNAGFSGTLIVDINLSDGVNSVTQESVSIVWSGDVVLPVIEDLSGLDLEEDEDTDLVVDLSGKGRSGSEVWSVRGFDGDVVVNGDQITFTPEDDFFGSDEIALILTDPATNGVDIEPLTLAWLAVNDVPVAGEVAFEVDEGGTVSALFLDGEDPDTGDTITYEIVKSAGEGDVTFNAATGEFSYAHRDGEADVDIFTYKVTDDASPPLSSAPAPVTVSVVSQNDVPVAVAKSFSVNEGDLYVGAFEASDGDGDVLTYVIDDVPAYGKVVLINGQTGDFSYQHDGGEFTPDGFSFFVHDGTVASASVNVEVLVNNENDLPVVYDIPNQTITSGEVFADIDLNEYVFDAETVDKDIVWSFIGNTELVIAIDENQIASIALPSADWKGSETVTFMAEDSAGFVDSDTVTFTSIDVPILDELGYYTSSVNPLISWGVVPGALSYSLEISSTAGFSALVRSETVLVNEYQVDPALENLSFYYFRVRANYEGGVTSDYSAVESTQLVQFPDDLADLDDLAVVSAEERAVYMSAAQTDGGVLASLLVNETLTLALVQEVLSSVDAGDVLADDVAVLALVSSSLALGEIMTEGTSSNISFDALVLAASSDPEASLALFVNENAPASVTESADIVAQVLGNISVEDLQGDAVLIRALAGSAEAREQMSDDALDPVPDVTVDVLVGVLAGILVENIPDLDLVNDVSLLLLADENTSGDVLQNSGLADHLFADETVLATILGDDAVMSVIAADTVSTTFFVDAVERMVDSGDEASAAVAADIVDALIAYPAAMDEVLGSDVAFGILLGSSDGVDIVLNNPALLRTVAEDPVSIATLVNTVAGDPVQVQKALKNSAIAAALLEDSVGVVTIQKNSTTVLADGDVMAAIAEDQDAVEALLAAAKGTDSLAEVAVALLEVVPASMIDVVLADADVGTAILNDVDVLLDLIADDEVMAAIVADSDPGASSFAVTPDLIVERAAEEIEADIRLIDAVLSDETLARAALSNQSIVTQLTTDPANLKILLDNEVATRVVLADSNDGTDPDLKISNVEFAASVVAMVPQNMDDFTEAELVERDDLIISALRYDAVFSEGYDLQVYILTVDGAWGKDYIVERSKDDLDTALKFLDVNNAGLQDDIKNAEVSPGVTVKDKIIEKARVDAGFAIKAIESDGVASDVIGDAGVQANLRDTTTQNRIDDVVNDLDAAKAISDQSVADIETFLGIATGDSLANAAVKIMAQIDPADPAKVAAIINAAGVEAAILADEESLMALIENDDVIDAITAQSPVVNITAAEIVAAMVDDAAPVGQKVNTDLVLLAAENLDLVDDIVAHSVVMEEMTDDRADLIALLKTDIVGEAVSSGWTNGDVPGKTLLELVQAIVAEDTAGFTDAQLAERDAVILAALAQPDLQTAVLDQVLFGGAQTLRDKLLQEAEADPERAIEVLKGGDDAFQAAVITAAQDDVLALARTDADVALDALAVPALVEVVATDAEVQAKLKEGDTLNKLANDSGVLDALARNSVAAAGIVDVISDTENVDDVTARIVAVAMLEKAAEVIEEGGDDVVAAREGMEAVLSDDDVVAALVDNPAVLTRIIENDVIAEEIMADADEHYPNFALTPEVIVEKAAEVVESYPDLAIAALGNDDLAGEILGNEVIAAEIIGNREVLVEVLKNDSVVGIIADGNAGALPADDFTDAIIDIAVGNPDAPDYADIVVGALRNPDLRDDVLTAEKDGETVQDIIADKAAEDLDFALEVAKIDDAALVDAVLGQHVDDGSGSGGTISLREKILDEAAVDLLFLIQSIGVVDITDDLIGDLEVRTFLGEEINIFESHIVDDSDFDMSIFIVNPGAVVDIYSPDSVPTNVTLALIQAAEEIIAEDPGSAASVEAAAAIDYMLGNAAAMTEIKNDADAMSDLLDNKETVQKIAEGSVAGAQISDYDVVAAAKDELEDGEYELALKVLDNDVLGADLLDEVLTGEKTAKESLISQAKGLVASGDTSEANDITVSLLGRNEAFSDIADVDNEDLVETLFADSEAVSQMLADDDVREQVVDNVAASQALLRKASGSHKSISKDTAIGFNDAGLSVANIFAAGERVKSNLDLGLDPDNPDTDGDGTLDADEIVSLSAPEDTDGDGMIDALEIGENSPESLIFKLPAVTADLLGLGVLGQKQIAIFAPGVQKISSNANGLTGVPVYSENNLVVSDDAYDFPVGLFDFDVELAGGQSQVQVTVTLEVDLPANPIFRKLRSDNSWATFENVVFVDGVSEFVLTLTDNDSFDLDPALGVIRDPGGPVEGEGDDDVVVVTPPDDTPDDTPDVVAVSDSGSGGGSSALRHAGQTREEYAAMNDLGLVTKDNFEEVYKKSLVFAEERNQGRAGKVIARTGKDGKSQFIGYLPGRMSSEDFKVFDRVSLRSLGRGTGSGFMAAAAKPGVLMKQFTTFDMLDVPNRSRYYSDVVTVMSLGVLRTDRQHLFYPRQMLSWRDLLFAAVRASDLEVDSFLSLRRERLDKIVGMPLENDFDSRVFYTALAHGLIDSGVDINVLPTREEAIRILTDVFDLEINDNARNTSFVDVDSDDDLAPILVAAKKSGWFRNFNVREFDASQVVSRQSFASWFASAFEDVDVEDVKESSFRRFHPRSEKREKTKKSVRKRARVVSFKDSLSDVDLHLRGRAKGLSDEQKAELEAKLAVPDWIPNDPNSARAPMKKSDNTAHFLSRPAREGRVIRDFRKVEQVKNRDKGLKVSGRLLQGSVFGD